MFTVTYKKLSILKPKLSGGGYMSQSVLHGGYEPEPERIRAVTGEGFYDADKTWALQQHLINTVCHAELIQLFLPPVPQKIGALLLEYPHVPTLHQIQQN
jgi:hypothetical protein